MVIKISGAAKRSNDNPHTVKRTKALNPQAAKRREDTRRIRPWQSVFISIEA
jgi:hypothetical protein